MQQTLIIKNKKLMDLNTYIKAERTNRYKAAAIKKEWTTAVTWEAKVKKLKAMQLPVSVCITFYLKDKRRDKDNLLINTKWLLDGLAQAGVIKNDGWDAISGIYFDWYISKEERMHIIIDEKYI